MLEFISLKKVHILPLCKAGSLQIFVSCLHRYACAILALSS